MVTSSELSVQDVDPSERVEHHIRHAIMAVDNGERLPSVRQLMRRCNAGKSAVERALSRLQGEGLVESRARSGLYRIGGASVKETVVEYLYFCPAIALEGNRFHSDLFSCLSSAFAMQSRFFRLNVMECEKDVPALVARLIRSATVPVITCGIGLSDLLQVAQLAAANISVLHLLPNFTEPINESLILDDEAIVRLQVEHLVKCGYRKVAYLHAAADNEYIRPLNARRDAFLRLCVDYGLELRPGWVVNSRWENDAVMSALCPLLKAQEKPQALVINDGTASGVYAAIRACGLTPGVDIGVIGCDDMPWDTHIAPPLTSVRVSRPMIARMTCDLIDRMITGQKVGRNLVPPELIVRESTVPRGAGKSV